MDKFFQICIKSYSTEGRRGDAGPPRVRLLRTTAAQATDRAPPSWSSNFKTRNKLLHNIAQKTYIMFVNLTDHHTTPSRLFH